MNIYTGNSIHMAIRRPYVWNWKAIRLKVRGNPDASINLYNLKTDIGETNDIAADHPDVVKRIAPLFHSARTSSKNFPLFTARPKPKKK